MKVIGITGGIGSGKSLVANILREKHGAYIINTDRIAKEQMEVGGVSYQGVIEFFGKDILSEDGSIHRGRLAEIVFHDKEKLLKLNELTHPLVLKAVKEEIHSMESKGDVPFFAIETALMIESGYDSACDEVWYVYAQEAHRRKWLMKERNYSEERIASVFESQSKAEDFRRKFPMVIENTGDINLLEQQVEQLLNREQPHIM